jgi:hypothetical protein
MTSTYLIHQLKSTPRRVPAKIHTRIHKEFAPKEQGTEWTKRRTSNLLSGLLLPDSAHTQVEASHGSARSVCGDSGGERAKWGTARDARRLHNRGTKPDSDLQNSPDKSKKIGGAALGKRRPVTLAAI